MVDNFSEKQIVVTGSSSFDLTGEIEESLTGRKIDFILFPFSLEILRSIAYSYAFKDIFKLYQIRNPEVLEKLLQALSLQLGNEVSYNELAGLTG